MVSNHISIVSGGVNQSLGNQAIKSKYAQSPVNPISQHSQNNQASLHKPQEESKQDASAILNQEKALASQRQLSNWAQPVNVRSARNSQIESIPKPNEALE